LMNDASNGRSITGNSHQYRYMSNKSWKSHITRVKKMTQLLHHVK
jgi:hypothetical protein